MINAPMELGGMYKPLHLVDWRTYEFSASNMSGIWYFVLGHQML